MFLVDRYKIHARTHCYNFAKPFGWCTNKEEHMMTHPVTRGGAHSPQRTFLVALSSPESSSASSSEPARDSAPEDSSGRLLLLSTKLLTPAIALSQASTYGRRSGLFLAIWKRTMNPRHRVRWGGVTAVNTLLHVRDGEERCRVIDADPHGRQLRWEPTLPMQTVASQQPLVLGVLIRPSMRENNCPICSRNYGTIISQKIKG